MVVRVHERIDDVFREVAVTRSDLIDRLGAIQTQLASIMAENAGVRTTVAAFELAIRDHEARLRSLEHDRSRIIGWMMGAAGLGAGGGIGVAKAAQALGLLP